MAYVAPSLATFRARFPEFAPVSDALVSLILSDAISQIGDTWYERDRAKAQLILAAHLLASEGEPARSSDISNGGDGSATLASGALRRRKVGDVEVEFAGQPSSSGGAGAGRLDAAYGSTIYGLRFLELMRLNFPAIGAV